MRSLIIIISIAVVALTIGTIIVGNRMFDGVVVERPYETGLSWDETKKRQAQLGWKVIIETARLKQGGNELILRLTDREGAALNNASVSVTVSRPSSKAYDQTYRAAALGGGRYRATISLPLIGLWDLQTEITRANDLFTATERVEATE